jgi:hypothetical protein
MAKEPASLERGGARALELRVWGAWVRVAAKLRVRVWVGCWELAGDEVFGFRVRRWGFVGVQDLEGGWGPLWTGGGGRSRRAGWRL